MLTNSYVRNIFNTRNSCTSSKKYRNTSRNRSTNRFLTGIFLFDVFFLPHARTDFLTRIVVIVVVELVCVRSTKNNVKAVVVEVIGVLVEREVEIIVGIEVPVDLTQSRVSSTSKK